MIKNNKFLKENCNSLILFTSESCNLQCSYCEMASHMNAQLHAQETKNVKESLVNGKYLNTIQQAFTRLEINPDNITQLQIWGQEPTLTLKEFSVFFPGLYDYCSNISNMVFSTNGVNINNIFFFVETLIKTVSSNFHLMIQFSFDGEFLTYQNRGVNPQIIINNIKKLILYLNKIDLKFISIDINLHNVIDINVINKYSKEENIDELYSFLNNFSDLHNLFINLNTNTQVTINPCSGALVNPINASIEDGKNLFKFYKNCKKVGQQIEYKIIWQSIPRSVLTKVPLISYQDILNYLEQLNPERSVNARSQLLQKLSNELSCGFNYGCLKIRYDGTLIHCQNALLGLLPQELERQGSNYLIQKRKKMSGFYPNILSDSDDIIDKYLYQSTLHNEESFAFGFSSVCNLMNILLKAEQIDSKYNDLKEFIKCAYFITLSTTCIHNAMMYAGSYGGKYVGWIRFLCNGFMELLYESCKEDGKESVCNQ